MLNIVMKAFRNRQYKTICEPKFVKFIQKHQQRRVHSQTKRLLTYITYLFTYLLTYLLTYLQHTAENQLMADFSTADNATTIS